MCEQANLLTCIGWEPYPQTAICEHPGCPWVSTGATVTAQTEAFIAHHAYRHGEGQ